MIRFRNFAPALLIGTALSACNAGKSDGSGKPGWVSNRSYYSENQPVVERTNYVLDIATSGSSVPGTEIGRLGQWFDSLDLRYGDKVYLEDPYGSAGVRSDVARLTAEYGLLLSDGAPVTAGTPSPGSARVIVKRATASVPGCSNWRQAKNTPAVQSTESDYGCATNSNIAAMIADPEDLVGGGESDSGTDAIGTAKAISTYRNRSLTGGGGTTVKEVSTK